MVMYMPLIRMAVEDHWEDAGALGDADEGLQKLHDGLLLWVFITGGCSRRGGAVDGGSSII